MNRPTFPAFSPAVLKDVRQLFWHCCVEMGTERKLQILFAQTVDSTHLRFWLVFASRSTSAIGLRIVSNLFPPPIPDAAGRLLDLWLVS